MLSKVLNKNCVSIKCAAKQPAPQKAYTQMLGRTLSVASLILRGLLLYKDIFCFCVQFGAGCWGKERFMKETIALKQA